MTSEILKQLTRHSQVVGTAGKIAMHWAAHTLNPDSADFAATLTQSLGELKGPFVKIAQLAALVPDLIPKEYADHFRTLQAHAPSMGALLIRRRMSAELGENWKNLFRFFDITPAAAASLGQVHRAEDFDGHQLACKVQYPNMSVNVKADMQQLRFLFSLYDTYDGALNHDEILAEIEERLYEELDYEKEARSLQFFQKILSPFPFIHIPKSIPSLSTSKLLTMTFLEGTSIFDFMTASQEVRNRIAKQLFIAWYFPLYQYGILHADPHTGNYLMTQDDGLALLDFGCVRIFSPSFIEGMIQLYHALLTQDQNLAIRAYQAWGFQKLTPDLIEALTVWATYLYEPLLDNRVRPIEYSLGGKKGKEVAARVYDALKKAGGITPPREFVFIDRATVALGSVFIHLKAELNWCQLFKQLIQDFSVHQMVQRQALFLP